jgi:hypothetical protein
MLLLLLVVLPPAVLPLQQLMPSMAPASVGLSTSSAESSM